MEREGERERARASLSMKPVMHEGHVEPVVSSRACSRWPVVGEKLVW